MLNAIIRFSLNRRFAVLAACSLFSASEFA